MMMLMGVTSTLAFRRRELLFCFCFLFFVDVFVFFQINVANGVGCVERMCWCVVDGEMHVVSIV